ncbi:MAG: hypothetical protein KDA65_02950, partial [Planctomycetaceae bacterium]|nr:hypothetical protein [Planctomycetaceae bacterium]
ANTALIVDFPDRSGDPDAFQYFRTKGYQVKSNGLYEYVEVPLSEQMKFYDSLPDYPAPKLMALDAQTGEMKWIEVIPNGYSNSFLSPEGQRLTPDRRYLIMSNSSSSAFMFFDVHEQKVAGAIIPALKEGASRLTTKQWGFSSDGKQLAILMKTPGSSSTSQSYFQMYDLVTGKLAHEVLLPGDINEKGGLRELNGTGVWLVSSRYLLDVQSGAIIGEFGVKESGLKFILESNRLDQSSAMYVSRHEIFLIGGGHISRKQFLQRWPLLTDEVLQTVNNYRNDTSALIKKGSEVAIRVDFQDPEVPADEGALQVIKEVLQEKARKAGLVPVEEAEFTLALYYGSEITKPVYEKNKEVVIRSPGELFDKPSYSMKNSNPNAILGFEDSSGKLVWGEAVELPKMLMQTRVGEFKSEEEQKNELNFDSEPPPSSSGKKREATPEVKARSMRSRLTTELNMIRMPFYIPENGTGVSLPVLMFYDQSN